VCRDAGCCGPVRAYVPAMTLEMIVIWALVGLVAGWLASQVVRGGGSGVLSDILIGIVGAFLGGVIFRAAGWHVPIAGYGGLIFVAFCGAAVLLVVMRLVSRRRA
jgi:uncharacterized membrane protein YeaQ/YmgE (transglycosylase-associated protein family)